MSSIEGNISGKQALTGEASTLVGLTPNIQVGITEIVDPNMPAKVELDANSTKLNPVFNFSIPKGEKGEKGDAGSVKFIIANELPTEDIDESAIYMIPAGTTSDGNTYAEYIYVNGKWESLGSASVNVDLTDYVKNTDYATKETAGVVKINNNYGVNISPTTQQLQVASASNAQIDNKSSSFNPIVPLRLDYAVKSSLTTHSLEWTDEEKTSARDLINAQSKLTAGENITIEGNVISASSGGSNDVGYYNGAYSEHNDKNYHKEQINNLLSKGCNVIIYDNSSYGTYISMRNKLIEIKKSTTQTNFDMYLVGFSNTGALYNLQITGTCENGLIKSINTFTRTDYSALAKNNTSSYTPTSNYNPSTKLYTDKTHYENMTGYDASKTQVLKNIQGVLTWVDE